MITQNNVLHVQIAKDVARTSSVTIGTLANGETALFNVDGTLLTTASTVDRFVIVQGRGTTNPPLISPVIKKGKVLSYKAVAYSAPVEQITYIGYNGTSGAIEEINDNTYLARISRKDLEKTFGNKHMLKFGVYKSDSSATQEEIAKGLTESFIANFKREPEETIKFERVNSGTQTDIGTGVNNVTFTKGSTTISSSGPIDDATGSTALAAGVYIVVGTSANSPVYKIVSIDTTAETAVLDVAFQGDSVVLADTALKQITAANLADFGIKLTGVKAKFKEGSFRYHKVQFTVELMDFGTTDLTYDTAADKGKGFGEEVAELEWFAQGNEGNYLRIGTPPPVMRKDAEDAVKYSLVSIEFFDDEMDGTVQGVKPSRKQFILAVNVDDGTEGTSITDASSGTAIILDDQIVTDWGFGTAQAGNIA